MYAEKTSARIKRTVAIRGEYHGYSKLYSTKRKYSWVSGNVCGWVGISVPKRKYPRIEENTAYKREYPRIEENIRVYTETPADNERNARLFQAARML